jgi:hypothetical protein
MPLQIKNINNNNNKINNSVISFYRSIDNSKYSGIELCDDSTNLSMVNKNKWYIYKNHVTDDFNYVGPLQIGYMKNSYTPSKSCINLYYDNSKYYVDINNPITYNSANEFNKNKEDVRIHGNVRISGDLELDGSINIKGNYKFNDNNILFSPNPVEKIISKIYSLGNNVYYFDTILSPNHPKNISFKNSNLTLIINNNIIDDNANLNLELNITNATNNYNISSNNYLLYSNLNLNINNYSNINNTINYYNETLKSDIISTATNNLNTYLSYTTQNLATPSIIITNDVLIQGALSNKNNAYSNYLISSNIYKAINNIYVKPITSYISQATEKSNLSYQNMNNISSSYNTITYNDDINIITKLSSNIYKLASNVIFNVNNYTNIPTISPFTTAYVNISSNYMISMSNIYITTSNYYETLISESSSITVDDYNSILSSIYEYSIINSDNINQNSNNIIAYNSNYSNLTYNIITPIKNISTINLTTSQSNLNLTNKIYKTISTPITNYLTYTQKANEFASNNSNLNNTIDNATKNYSNIINDALITRNTYSKYNYLQFDDRYSENNNSNYYIYNASAQSPTPEIIKNKSTINKDYSSNLYHISSNIYDIFDNLKTDIITPNLTFATTYSNTSYTNYVNISNNFIQFSNIYSDSRFITNINNIYRANDCNFKISSNIYMNSSNYAAIMNNINIDITTCINKASIDKTYSLEVYNTCINTNTNKDTLNIDQLIFNNRVNASNILKASSNITDNIVNTYSELYDKMIVSQNIYQPTLSEKIIAITNKLITSINTNINTYELSSISNKTIASNLDNDISKFDPDYSEKLEYYQNLQEVGSGITKLISFIAIEKDIYINNRTNLIDLFNDYIIDDYLIDAYNNLMNSIDICVNILIELDADANNLTNYSDPNNITNYSIQLPILLELILHITNKYINFINKSFDFANATSQVVATINDHIGIYIISSLSILPLLTTISQYANTYLDHSWRIISRQIVLFASISYSLNSMIPTIAPNDTQEGNNTDVLIIGNNIKLFPTKALIVGQVNDNSRWLENLDDNINSSAGYFYNYNSNSCACSFNVKAKKFISDTQNKLSLKTSGTIDLNLIDTSISDHHNSMFDGVSLKLSHIYRREDVHLVDATSNNTIFEIVRKQNLNNPYFSIYTNDVNNIFNIGGGIFYDDNNNCIIQDSVVHINQNTTTYLLKLTNPSANSSKFVMCNNNNKWTLAADDKFSFIYNTTPIINLNTNGLSINTTSNNGTLTINSFNDITALELKNNYSSSPTKTKTLNLKNSLIVDYTEDGIKYSNNITTDAYDLSTVSFEVNCNITLNSINDVLSNVVVSYNNINDTNPFTFTINENKNIVNLLPKLNLNDTKLSYTINNSNIYEELFNKDGIFFTITYITPTSNSVISLTTTTLNDPESLFDLVIQTKLIQKNTDASDYSNISIYYTVNNIRIKNIIEFNIAKSFEIETLNLTLNSYNYNLVRPLNIVPKDLYNNAHTNTITSSITNTTVSIINNLNYLKEFTPQIIKHQYSFEEIKLKNYPVGIFESIYYIQITINITDNYHLYFNKNEDDQTTISLEYINKNAKQPIMRLLNIYNNSHNIYSYTNDYEIYLNDNKLLNISPLGTLTTTGNIETNNLYLKGDIYNADGISLYDNILSLMNNISSSANLELHSRNIILNPGIGLNDYYKGGVLINGNNINEINNNIFQINNYAGNDNLMTLNSSSSNSFIHFINKIQNPLTLANITTIYRLGNSNGSFGIWKEMDEIPYNNNYFIDGSKVYQQALNISYVDNRFELYTSGKITELSDKRLKKDIKKIENALDKLISLNGITYLLNDGQKRETGVIAQEVKEVLPEAVSIDPNGYYSVAYGNLAGLMIEAIKELKNEIDQIKLKI